MGTSSTRIDVNYLSINDDRVYVLYAGRVDENGKPNFEYIEKFPNPPVLTPTGSLNYASILKICHPTFPIEIDDLVLSQASENCLDIDDKVHGVKLTNVNFGVGGGQGDQVITIKGDATNIYISGVLHTRGKRGGVDVDIGNWCDQTYAMSKNIVLDLRHIDGKPVNVRIGRATNVTLRGSCKKMVWSSINLKIYWWVKWAVRKLFKIPVGVKGPSWM